MNSKPADARKFIMDEALAGGERLSVTAVSRLLIRHGYYQGTARTFDFARSAEHYARARLRELFRSGKVKRVANPKRRDQHLYMRRE